jgi:hypothetical protein
MQPSQAHGVLRRRNLLSQAGLCRPLPALPTSRCCCCCCCCCHCCLPLRAPPPSWQVRWYTFQFLLDEVAEEMEELKEALEELAAQLPYPLA